MAVLFCFAGSSWRPALGRERSASLGLSAPLEQRRGPAADTAHLRATPCSSAFPATESKSHAMPSSQPVGPPDTPCIWPAQLPNWTPHITYIV